MQPNDDLSRWGEPPASAAELQLAEQLADALRCSNEGIQVRSAAQVDRLVEASNWIDSLIEVVLEHSGLSANAPPPAPAEGHSTRVHLELTVSRQEAGRFTPVTPRTPGVFLRDLVRVNDDPSRVELRTGDRIRLEVRSSAAGWLVVFNVGPTGRLNLLYPSGTQAAPCEAGISQPIFDVQLAPPAGREKVYVVWSAAPAGVDELVRLVGPGKAHLRNLVRVQDRLEETAEWQALLVELDHAP